MWLTAVEGQLKYRIVRLKILFLSAILRLQKTSLDKVNTIRSGITALVLRVKQLRYPQTKYYRQNRPRSANGLLPSLFRKVRVKYSGPWAESSGYANANRNFIKSLHEAGIDVCTELQVYSNHPTDYGEKFQLARSLQNKEGFYPIKILHITPNVYERHKEPGKYHIGHLFWETTKMGDKWDKYLNHVDEIWTGCEWNKKTFQDAGFRGPIRVIPEPVDTDIKSSRLPIDAAKGYVFYSIFQWIERKAPKSLLQAYWKEFSGENDVTLVIKTYGLSFDEGQRSKIYQDIKQWKHELRLSHYPRVLVIDYLLSDKEIHQLHESGDCFVSAHRGEGWGVPQCEALAHGKPVISTGLGGMHEWISDQGMLKVKYSMIDVFNMEKHEAYMVSGNKWGKVDENDLRAKMRLVFSDRNYANQVAQIGQQEVKDKMNYKTVGAMMLSRLSEIYEEKGLI